MNSEPSLRVHPELRISFFSCRDGEGITTLTALCCLSWTGLGVVKYFGKGEGFFKAWLSVVVVVVLFSE